MGPLRAQLHPAGICPASTVQAHALDGRAAQLRRDTASTAQASPPPKLPAGGGPPPGRSAAQSAGSPARPSGRCRPPSAPQRATRTAPPSSPAPPAAAAQLQPPPRRGAAAPHATARGSAAARGKRAVGSGSGLGREACRGYGWRAGTRAGAGHASTQRGWLVVAKPGLRFAKPATAPPGTVNTVKAAMGGGAS
jgi:hypothetical protein